MNEGTNGQTNRQLARGPSEPSGARKRPWGARDLERAWSRAITRPRQPRHYPQLSVCVLRLGFRVPSGARIRARATARHRDPNVHPHRPRRYGAQKEGVEGQEMQRETGAPAIHYVASAVRHGSISPFWRDVWSARLFSYDRKSHAIETVACFAATVAESVKISTDGCVILKYLN